VPPLWQALNRATIGSILRDGGISHQRGLMISRSPRGRGVLPILAHMGVATDQPPTTHCRLVTDPALRNGSLFAGLSTPTPHEYDTDRRCRIFAQGDLRRNGGRIYTGLPVTAIARTGGHVGGHRRPAKNATHAKKLVNAAERGPIKSPFWLASPHWITPYGGRWRGRGTRWVRPVALADVFWRGRNVVRQAATRGALLISLPEEDPDRPHDALAPTTWCWPGKRGWSGQSE